MKVDCNHLHVPPTPTHTNWKSCTKPYYDIHSYFLQLDIEIPTHRNSTSKQTPPLIIIIIHFLLLNTHTILGLRGRLGDGYKN